MIETRFVRPHQINDLSDREKEAVQKLVESPNYLKEKVSLDGLFVATNCWKELWSELLFARIEKASESSKYETGSEIVSIYMFNDAIFNIESKQHGRKIAEVQLDCGDYVCTDYGEPYKPQPAYYYYGGSRKSLLTWEYLEKTYSELNVSSEEVDNALFSRVFLGKLLMCLKEDLSEIALLCMDIYSGRPLQTHDEFVESFEGLSSELYKCLDAFFDGESYHISEEMTKEIERIKDQMKPESKVAASCYYL